MREQGAWAQAVQLAMTAARCTALIVSRIAAASSVASAFNVSA